MASSHNVRSALNGFNREDVVHYLEYLNARQQAEQNRLQAEIGRLTAEVERLQKAPAPQDVTGELEAANRRCAELEERCTRLQAELEQAKAASAAKADDELEAYRRAERAERTAQARADQIYLQATGVLADATAKVQEASELVSGASDQLSGQLEQWRQAVESGKSLLTEAAGTLAAIRPAGDET